MLFVCVAEMFAPFKIFAPCRRLHPTPLHPGPAKREQTEGTCPSDRKLAVRTFTQRCVATWTLGPPEFRGVSSELGAVLDRSQDVHPRDGGRTLLFCRHVGGSPFQDMKKKKSELNTNHLFGEVYKFLLLLTSFSSTV